MYPIKICFVSSVVAFVLGVASFQQANADEILEVSGPEPADSGQIIEPGEAAAVMFSLTRPFDDVTFSAPIVCIGCTGGISLVQDSIGPGTSVLNSVETISLDVGTTSPFFSPVDLDPGDYFVVVSIDTGSAAWLGSTLPTITTEPGVVHGLDFRSDNAAPFAPNSDFSPIFGAGALQYTLEATVVPEPASGVVMLSLLSSMCMRRRRHVR